MRKSLVFLALLTSLSACKKDSPLDVPEPASKNIRFDLPAVGQVSRYLGLAGEDYYTNNYDHFEYSDDTLRLEIVAKDNNGYKVAETLHYVDVVHSWLDWDKDSTYYYYLRVTNDTLKVIPIGETYLRSRIFAYNLSQQGLPLKKIESPEVEILGWKTSFNYCECRQTGYAENYSLFGKTYDRLNVIVENSAMALDGNGETYVFSKPFGIVRFSTYGWWTQSGYGWDLLPQNNSGEKKVL